MSIYLSIENKFWITCLVSESNLIEVLFLDDLRVIEVGWLAARRLLDSLTFPLYEQINSQVSNPHLKQKKHIRRASRDPIKKGI